jgi:hypothetical protein
MDPVNGRNRATITYGLSGRHPSYLDVAGLDGFFGSAYSTRGEGR